MSLASTPTGFGPGQSTNPTAQYQSRTLGDAIRFLESLKPRIDDLLRALAPGPAPRARKVRVALNSMDTMKTEKGGEAHVLWVGPKIDANGRGIPDEETVKLKHVCGKLEIRPDERAGNNWSIFAQTLSILHSKQLASWLRIIAH